MGCRNSRIKFRGYGYIRQNCDSANNEPHVSNNNCEMVLNTPASFHQPQELSNEFFGNNVKNGLNSNTANGMSFKQNPNQFNGIEMHPICFSKQFQAMLTNKFEQDLQPFVQHLQLDRMLPPVSLQKENIFPIAPLIAPPLAMPNFPDSYQSTRNVPASPLAMPPLAMPPLALSPMPPMPPLAMPPMLSMETMPPLAIPPMHSLETIPQFAIPSFYQSKNISFNHMNNHNSNINNLNNSNIMNNMANLNNPNSYSQMKPNNSVHMPLSLPNFNKEQMNNLNASFHGRFLASNSFFSPNTDFKNSFDPNFVAKPVNSFCTTPNTLNMRFLNPINAQ